MGTYKDVECRFMFDPAEGQLLAVEMFPVEDVDPCEVYFLKNREVDGRFLPARMEVRIGDDVYAIFELADFQFGKDEEP